MKKRLLFIFLGLIFTVVGVFAYHYSVKKPPLTEINLARQNINKAKKLYGAKYAPETFRKACQNYDSAMVHWNNENQKLVINRNYFKVKYFAERANSLAHKSIKQTNENIIDVRSELQKGIEQLTSKIEYFDANFGNFPLEKGERKKLSQSKMLLNEGKIALKRANYFGGVEKTKVAIADMDALNAHYEKVIKEYFKNYRNWEKWVDGSISYSRKNKTHCIVVDKYARTCYLYKNGQLQHTYEVELGPNWVGSKKYQGDKSTPEGIYKITKKKSDGHSKYHKALLIDYPNDEDKERFNELKKRGVIQPNAKIGSMIEIHGDGGKGIDWTSGCVALSNDDIDKLYKVCSEGTRVTIVGSVKPLNEILREQND